MKKIIFSCALISTMHFVNAQSSKSEEKIILQDNKPSTEVQIDIKDGNVYVDGKKVAPYALNRNLKIIKKFGKALADANMPDVNIEIDKDMFGNDATTANKPMLGVSTSPSKNNTGALINTVNANTPAATIGLKEGDIITKINKTTITSPQDLVEAISSYQPKDIVTIGFTRGDKQLTVQATLAARDIDQQSNIFGGPDNEDIMGNLQNMMKRFGDKSDSNNLFEGLEELGGDGNMKIFGKGYNTKSSNNSIGLQVQDRADNLGVLVTGVKDNSAAAKAGIQVNDVLTAVNGLSISNIDDLSHELANMDSSKEIEAEMMRAGKKLIIKIKLEKQLRKKDF